MTITRLPANQGPRDLRVLAVVPHLRDTAPGQRFRIEQWDPLLHRRGIFIEYAPFETKELHQVIHKDVGRSRKFTEMAKALTSRWRHLSSLKSYDLVYVFRECALIGPAFFEYMIRSSGVPYVFDFDDAVFLSYISPSNGALSLLKFASSKTRSLCRHAGHVMAGNQYLADYASQYNQNVTVVPTTIDTEKYRVGSNVENEVPVIGWSGSFSTVAHLQTVAPALRELAKQVPYRLRVIGGGDYELDGVDVDAKPWNSSTEVSDLSPIDVGIMPLPDDEWARGKCGLKALQYMALGKAVVCSPVGVNSEIVHHGENGFLAASSEEWVARLKFLINSPADRRKMGAAARTTVEKHYSAEVQAPRVADIFEFAANQGRARHSAANIVRETQNQ